MQKYLHSKKRPRKRIMFVLAVCIGIVSLTAALNKIRIDSVASHSDSPLPKYLTVSVKQTDSNLFHGLNLKNNDEKMNNETLNNSKSTSDIAENARQVLTDGSVNVLLKDGTVKNMPLEEYVYGCLVGEMPLTFHPQALMAQSVAIRSFTVEKMCSTGKHKNAQVCTNPSCCQNYVQPNKSGYSDELLQVAYESVKATKGIIAVWQGNPINAVYHASSGENTRDSKDVWGGEVAYLKSVSSPGGESEICTAFYGGNGGHGVGMSQQGANLLAQDGYSYAEILCYYYSGIGLDFLCY